MAAFPIERYDAAFTPIGPFHLSLSGGYRGSNFGHVSTRRRQHSVSESHQRGARAGRLQRQMQTW